MTNLEKLSKLGPLYHSYFGFNNHCQIYVDTEEEAIWYQDNLEADYQQQSEEYMVFWPDSKSLILEANNSLFQESLKRVIIKYQKNTWYQKPKENWFNHQSRWFDLSLNRLPYLKSRSYIKVIDPYMKVKVSAKKKGSPLTIEDILFATRALMSDETRTIDSYKVLKQDDTILVLEPQIDNFST